MQPCHYAINDLLYHAAPMILIDRVDAFDSETVRSSVEITPNSPFLADDVVPSYVSVEYMAQSVAAYSGIKAKISGGIVKIGYLASARKVDLNVPFFSIGDKLEITVKMIWNEPPMAVFDCRIERQNTIVASSRLNVYQP
jgi:predicted hotdog family 3-hydroxylacyl-ACP dehydratase